MREVITLGCEYLLSPSALSDIFTDFCGNTVTTLFNIVLKGFTRNAMEGASLHELHWFWHNLWSDNFASVENKKKKARHALDESYKWLNNFTNQVKDPDFPFSASYLLET